MRQTATLINYLFAIYSYIQLEILSVIGLPSQTSRRDEMNTLLVLQIDYSDGDLFMTMVRMIN